MFVFVHVFLLLHGCVCVLLQGCVILGGTQVVPLSRIQASLPYCTVLHGTFSPTNTSGCTAQYLLYNLGTTRTISC